MSAGRADPSDDLEWEVTELRKRICDLEVAVSRLERQRQRDADIGRAASGWRHGGPSSSTSASVHINLGGGAGDAAPAGPPPTTPAASPPPAPAAGSPPGGGTGPREVPPSAGLDAKIKHYCLTAVPQGWQPGTFRNYSLFAQVARDHSVAWSGRGCFSWHRDASGQAFDSRRLAEDHYRKTLGLPDDAHVPHWG